MVRDYKFGLVLSQEEQDILFGLAQQERISAAAVIRRLLWRTTLPTHNSDGSKSGRLQRYAIGPDLHSEVNNYPGESLGFFQAAISEPGEEQM